MATGNDYKSIIDNYNLGQPLTFMQACDMLEALDRIPITQYNIRFYNARTGSPVAIGVTRSRDLR